MRTIGLAVVAALVLAVAGCGEGDDPSAGASITAVATTTQLGDLVRQVGGERAPVEQILEPNADPHGYEPLPSDAAALADAEVVFESGGDLDEWLSGLVENAGGDAERVTLIDSVQTTERDGETDPHWWQDPANAIAAVEAIRAALTEADPAGERTYARNAKRYVARLRSLDQQVAVCIDSLPADGRELVTTHDALGYFADRYDLEVVGALIPSLSSQAQASSKDTGELVDQIRELGVPAIFPESSLDPRLEEAVAREAGAEVGDALYADTLGPRGSAGETYLGSIAANARAIAEGLGGDPAACRLAG